MDADEILKRDAERREALYSWISYADPERCISAEWLPVHRARLLAYFVRIAAAERALIEAVGAWIEGVKIDPNDNRAYEIDLSKYHLKMCDAYRALLAAMEEAQR